MTDYVRTAIAENISERLLDIKRQFGTIVEIGSGPGNLRHVLDAKRMNLEKIIMCDSSGEIAFNEDVKAHKEKLLTGTAELSRKDALARCTP